VTRSPSYRWLCQSASDHSVSLLPATQATGLLTLALAGLPPAGCASLRLDALGSQYRSEAESLSFSHPALDRSTTDGRPDRDEDSVSQWAVVPCRMHLAMWPLLKFVMLFLRCIPAFFRSRKEQDSPIGRPTECRPSPEARIVGLPRVGGLHHRYQRQEAA